MKPISFIIITYNRPDDTLELLQNLSHLQHATALIEEIVLVNNASTADYANVKAFIPKAHVPIKYVDAPGNLGVAKGRNFAVQFSKAPILVMLDDDAVLQNDDCLQKLLTEFERENTTKPKAIVSFKVLYYDTLEMQKNALPHKRYGEYKDKSFFETYFYAGGAHAIRRDVLNEVGKYPEDFFYGMEEYDLSYRILDAGYSIVYSDAVVMLHKESPLGRKPKPEKLRMMWVNKSVVAWRFLPKRYFFSTAFMWSLFYLKESGFQLKNYFLGWKMVAAIPKQTKSKTLKSETLMYLYRLKARLWY